MVTMELINTPVSTGIMSPRDSDSGFMAPPAPPASDLFSARGIADDQTPFDRERAAFKRLLPMLTKYSGHFVAIHNGQVVDFDMSRNVLVQRFFRKHGEGASLYVGFIGARPSVQIPTPFIRRR